MVEVYPTNIWVRAKWQQERDAVRVPKGACPKISIADELDRFHVEMARGIQLGASFAAKRLEDKARLYAVTVAPRHPAWSTRVFSQIVDRSKLLRDEFDKMANAPALYNKAVAMMRQSWPQAQLDIEDWMDSGGGTRLASRDFALLVAGLREVNVQGQRMAYVSNKIEKGIVTEARRSWQAVDGGRPPTSSWLEVVNDLRMRLRPL